MYYVRVLFPRPVSTSGSVADISGFRCWQMSGRDGSAIFESGIVENVGVAVGIASLTLSVRVLFPLPGSSSSSVADISGFRCWPMSGRVDSAISGSGIVENVGAAVGIASLTLSVHLLFPLPVSTSGSVAEISGFRCWLMSGCVGSVITRSGTVATVGVAVGIASPSLSAQMLFLLPVFTSGSVADVGLCRQCHTSVGRGRKCKVSR